MSLAEVDEVIAHNVPYQGDAGQPTDLWIAPESAPIAGDMIVSDADWATVLAWPVTPGAEAYRSVDYTRSDPGQYFRVWQLNVEAPPGDALAIALGIAIDDDPPASTPTPGTWLSGNYNPLAPARTEVPGTNASVDNVAGACAIAGDGHGGTCIGWLPRDWSYGVATPASSPPLPPGTIGGDGAPINPANPPEPDQPSLETIMLAIASQVENELVAQVPDLTVYGKRQFNPTPPCIDVYPADPFHEQTAYGYRNRELFFTVRARVSVADQDAGQSLLLGLLDADSPTSVLRALATDRTLQGWADDSAVDIVSGYGLHQDVGEAPSLLGATWRLKVEL